MAWREKPAGECRWEGGTQKVALEPIGQNLRIYYLADCIDYDLRLIELNPMPTSVRENVPAFRG
jgi:hypothetical protein